jgi:hypothetical protein
VLRRTQVAPKNPKQGIGHRYLAILQKVENGGKCLCLGFCIYRFSFSVRHSKIRVVLLINCRQPSSQYLECFQYLHGTRPMRFRQILLEKTNSS